MEFRWIAAITLWTMLSGPVLVHWSTVIPRPSAEPPRLVQSLPAAADVDLDWTLPVVMQNEVP
jgi:hypothetical protein